MDTTAIEKVLSSVDENRVVQLTRNMIRIPSPRFEEEQLAKYLAAYMEGVGLEVELQEVPFAWGTTKQVIGRYRGTGKGSNLLMCSHLDSAVAHKYRAGWIVPGQERSRGDWHYYGKGEWTKDPFGGEVEDGWIYGIGAVDQKSGGAAMISAVEAIVRSGISLRGDIIVVGTAAEGAGALGAKHMMAQGLTSDYAIVIEFTSMDIVTISVGALMGSLRVDGQIRVLGQSVNPIVKMYDVINRLSQPISHGGWLTFEPHPDLPGFPRVTVREIESTGATCSILFDVRMVPGMSEETVRADFRRLIEELRGQDPGLRADLQIPGEPFTSLSPKQGTDHDNPIVQAMARWHKNIVGEEPVVGSGSRLGGASDTAALKDGGISSVVEYGPGRCEIWPMIDERCRVEDIVNATKVLAACAVEICG